VWQSSLSDSRQSKFGRNLAGGSIEIRDFGTDVTSHAPINYSIFKRQVQLGRSTTSGSITNATFFAPGEFRAFQCTDCHFLSGSYVNIQVSPPVIAYFNKSGSFPVCCKRSEQISF